MESSKGFIIGQYPDVSPVESLPSPAEAAFTSSAFLGFPNSTISPNSTTIIVIYVSAQSMAMLV
ncbi:hypothetical protein CK203_034002 [Vitis vinifera]|uniref:Uncharacterized protein n=1 Tax=Vitis vinifera TaxID=29760 RepID=A0A438IBG2_VITVI|nr:hypothetical protein CK203_034002 [Vitis vinifera]